MQWWLKALLLSIGWVVLVFLASMAFGVFAVIALGVQDPYQLGRSVGKLEGPIHLAGLGLIWAICYVHRPSPTSRRPAYARSTRRLVEAPPEVLPADDVMDVTPIEFGPPTGKSCRTEEEEIIEVTPIDFEPPTSKER